MLPRENRLPSPEMKSVMRSGRRVHGDGVTLIYKKRDIALEVPTRRLDPRLRGDDKGLSRFAFIVPVSADKRAVGRSRLKRLTRESVRLALPTIVPGWDGIFLVRKGPPKAQELLGRAGMLL